MAMNNNPKLFNSRSLQTVLATVLVGLSCFVLAPNLKATPLNLALNPSPDIFSGLISVNYDAGSGKLTADGWSLALNGASLLNGPGSFHLEATINNSGVLSSGLISVTDGAGLLVAGTLGTTLSDFGFDAMGTFEFRFTATAGSMMASYGTQGAIILSSTGFLGDFTGDFGNMGDGAADVATVPDAGSTAFMIGICLIALSLGRKLNQRFAWS